MRSILTPAEQLLPLGEQCRIARARGIERIRATRLARARAENTKADRVDFGLLPTLACDSPAWAAALAWARQRGLSIVCEGGAEYIKL